MNTRSTPTWIESKNFDRELSYLREVRAALAGDNSLPRISTGALEVPRQNHQAQHPIARKRGTT